MTVRRILIGGLIALLLGLGVAYAALTKPPEGVAGPEADALARQIERAIDKAAWARTGAVAWTFGGRNQHLWDRARHLSRVTWGKDQDQVVVMFDIDDLHRGMATKGGQPVTGEALEKLIGDGYAKWVNDAFWLNPLAKLFDPGVVRKLLPEKEGKRRLLITYTSGGLTPGDSYLYTLGPDDLPVQWEMWVSIIPVGGVKATFEGWTTLATGAKVSTKHDMTVRTLELTDVRGAETVEALAGGDPFAPLMAASSR